MFCRIRVALVPWPHRRDHYNIQDRSLTHLDVVNRLWVIAAIGKRLCIRRFRRISIAAVIAAISVICRDISTNSDSF
jgi:hypothetical protein